MKKKLLNNLVLKIASLLFAFAVWFLVINFTDPTDTKTFSNIPITLINTDVLTDEQVYEVIENTDTVKSVTVHGPSSILLDLTADNIIAIADFENLTATQTVEIEFSSNIGNNDIEKIVGNISFVKLNIEDKKTSYLTLAVETQGEVAEGYLVDQVKPEQNRLTLTGPESVVSKVNKAVVKVDVSGATDNINTRGDVKLYDVDGVEITSDALISSLEAVSVNVQVLATKWLSIKYEITGSPASGYMETGEVTCEPSQVFVAGEEEVLSGLNSITIPEDVLNVTGQTTDLFTIINIADYLPNNIKFADDSYDGKVKITVGIEETIEKTFIIPGSQITITNIPDGSSAYIDTAREFNITLIGLADDIDLVQASQLRGVVDIENYAQENYNGDLEPGIYTMPIEFEFDSKLSIKDKSDVIVVIE